MKYFIGITGMSTAGKSTLAATLLSPSIRPVIFPIPHTTRRPPRDDDDNRLIRCIKEELYREESFLTIDQNYGTLNSDFQNFLQSNKSIAVSVISCNEVPMLREKIAGPLLQPIFISLTLTSSLEMEDKEIERRFPRYFQGASLPDRIERDKALARGYFFNEKYLKDNGVFSLNQQQGDVAQWIDFLCTILPISYDPALQIDIDMLKSIRS